MNRSIILLFLAASLVFAGCSNHNFTDYEDANDNAATAGTTGEGNEGLTGNLNKAAVPQP